ncbi:MAG: zinc-ribbon domain-containing protein [Coriobacteriaceae bacterium]|nr:zinc-ribbon domain-containing protein [Coriobacteriaceae bacterium]
MCGGYTRVCVRCGRCKSVRPRPLPGSGVCVRCGYENDAHASSCAACGTPLPKPPGAPAGFSSNASDKDSPR